MQGGSGGRVFRRIGAPLPIILSDVTQSVRSVSKKQRAGTSQNAGECFYRVDREFAGNALNVGYFFHCERSLAPR